MNFIVIGTFEAWAKLLPICQKNVDQVKENKKTWEGLTDSYEKMMKEGYNIKKLLEECDTKFEEKTLKKTYNIRQSLLVTDNQ